MMFNQKLHKNENLLPAILNRPTDKAMKVHSDMNGMGQRTLLDYA